MGLMVVIDWYTLQCSHYWTGLEDMAVHAHIQPCSNTSVEVEEEERPITVCVFSIWAFRTNSFPFFLFRGAFGNVLPWAVCCLFVFVCISAQIIPAQNKFILVCKEAAELSSSNLAESFFSIPTHSLVFSAVLRSFPLGGVNNSHNPIDPENWSLLILLH